MEHEFNLKPHISKQYSEDLEQLREDVMKMGGFVETQLQNALGSFVKGDVKLAKQTIKRDSDINQMEVDIDADCAKILALRQPTAGDLRLILTVVKSITDLERIGDLSQHLARMSKKLINKGVSTRYCADLEHLGNKVQDMLSGSLNAFARLDAEAAVETMMLDSDVNREFDALSRQLITYMMEDPRTIKQTLRVFNAARALERIGDHSKNLCEYTIFLVRGEDVRYQDIDSVREAILGDDDD